jgi:hypothetical protein
VLQVIFVAQIPWHVPTVDTTSSAHPTNIRAGRVLGHFFLKAQRRRAKQKIAIFTGFLDEAPEIT